MDLALYAGFSFDEKGHTGDELQELLESEFTILHRNDGKPWEINDDDGKVTLYKTIVICDGCDAGEAFPLGHETESPQKIIQKESPQEYRLS